MRNKRRKRHMPDKGFSHETVRYREGILPSKRIALKPEIHAGAWCPDLAAKEPYEEVHLELHVADGQKVYGSLDDYVLSLRFKGPDTLASVIEDLIMLRREVWKDCKPITGEDKELAKKIKEEI